TIRSPGPDRSGGPRRHVSASRCKPPAFGPWLLQLLGATAVASFDDLFPGSGGGARAWEVYTSCGTGTTTAVAKRPGDVSPLQPRRLSPRFATIIPLSGVR